MYVRSYAWCALKHLVVEQYSSHCHRIVNIISLKE